MEIWLNQTNIGSGQTRIYDVGNYRLLYVNFFHHVIFKRNIWYLAELLENEGKIYKSTSVWPVRIYILKGKAVFLSFSCLL